MAQVRICDRCGAPANPADSVTVTSRSVSIPASDPATRPVTGTGDVTLAFALVGGADLCDICQTSALLEYALARLGAMLTPGLLQAYSARINAVTGYKPN